MSTTARAGMIGDSHSARTWTTSTSCGARWTASDGPWDTGSRYVVDGTEGVAEVLEELARLRRGT